MNIITLAFINLLSVVVLSLLLVGCATQAPAALYDVKQAVHARATYANYAGWDKRVLEKGDAGNCAAFAYTYQHEAMTQGTPLFMTSCVLTNGVEHAFAITPDKKWVLDNRQRTVGTLADVGCK